MTKKDIIRMAREAGGGLESDYTNISALERFAALVAAAERERLAQPEQEPFGYFQYDPRLDAWVQNREGRPGTPFYTTQPQRKPLTHPQIHELDWPDGVSFDDILRFVRAIEAAHGIKGEA